MLIFEEDGPPAGELARWLTGIGGSWGWKAAVAGAGAGAGSAFFLPGIAVAAGEWSAARGSPNPSTLFPVLT